METAVLVENLSLGPFIKFKIEIPVNSLVVITGSNKSGKSLLLKVLAGVINTKNKVIYNKEIVKSNIDIAYFNKEVLYYDTVLKNIRYPLEALGYDDDKIVLLTRSIAKDLKINKLLDNKIDELTNYEKLKVALASSVINNPKILVLDDPCLYLSLEEKEDFMEILEQFRSRGMTIIIACSSLEEVVYTINCTLYVLDQGKIVSSGDMLDVLSNDSLLNKVGLELPFMIDLSVKLKYYNLISNINMNPLGMVMMLWK